MNERVNLKFLGWSLLSMVILGASWFGVHAFQMRKHRDALLAQVDRAEQQGKTERAIRLLGQFVKLAPEHVDARARYGLMLEKTAGGRNIRTAADVYQQVLIRDAERPDIRQRLARLLVAFGDIDDALTHLDKLQKKDTLKDAEAAEVQELLGRCYEVKSQYAEAAKHYRSAKDKDAKRIDSYIRCAHLEQQRLDKPEDANTLMDELVSKNKDSYRVYLARAEYRKLFHFPKAAPKVREAELAKSVADAAEARRLAPKEADALLVSADLARDQKDLKGARKFLEQGLKEHRDNPALYQALAAVEIADNRLDEAIVALRRGLELKADDQSLLFSLGQMLIQKGAPPEVEQVIDRLRKLKALAIYPDYLTARVAFSRGAWYQASLQLEALRPALLNAPQLAEQANLLLGQCYEHMGAVDRQLTVYRRAIRADSLNMNLKMAAAVTLARLGRLDNAIEETRQLMNFPTPPPSGWVLLAKLLVAQNLLLPPKQQEGNWVAVEAALTKAHENNPDSAEVTILQSEVLLARNKADEARKLLEQARDGKPRQGELWIALADLALRQGKFDVARTELDGAEKATGDGVNLRLARARYALRLKDNERSKILTPLAENLDKFSGEDRVRLLRELSNVWLRDGKPAEARRLWDRLVELRPQDLQVRLLLFDADLQSDNEGGMSKQLQAIKSIEAADGPLGHFAAASLLYWKAQKKGEKEGLTEAQAELTAAAARSPEWDKVPLLRAGIAELEGKEDTAIEHFLHAVELGNQQLPVIAHLVRLLYKNQRFTDADRVLRKIPEQSAFSAELQRLIAEVSLQNGDTDRAVELARKAIDANSKDFREHLWLGQMLWATKKTDEAEKVLRQAVKTFPDTADTWVILIQFLARTERAKEAEKVLHEAEGKLPKDKTILALAQCYEAVGKPNEAQKRYEEALKAQPDDLKVHQSAASFYLRVGKNDLALTELKKIITLKNTPAETTEQTKRLMMVVLSSQEDYQMKQEALRMLGLLDKGQVLPEAKKTDPEELRVRAVVLANQRGRGKKKQAIELLNRLDVLRKLLPEEQFLLAQLYEMVGDTAKAREQMFVLLGKRGNEPRYLAFQVQMQLRHGQLDQAERWLDHLEKIAPKTTRTVELKARVLKEKGETQKIVPMMTEYLRDNPGVTVVSVALFYESLGLPGPAEEMYRKHAAELGKPNNVLALAEFLARQKRTRDALEVCRTAWSTCAPVDAANTSSRVLHLGQANAEQNQLVIGWIEDALKKKDAPALDLLVCLAYAQGISGNTQKAVSLYRDILRRDPRKADALNNLAWLLGFDSSHGEEALALADQAQKILGPIPEVADTHAIALMSLGRAEQAIDMLQEALTQDRVVEETRMSLYFHLAQAQLMAGRPTEAEEALRNAKLAGLNESKLHPLERPHLGKLLAAMGKSE